MDYILAGGGQDFLSYLPCLDGLALFTLEPIRFDLRPLHSDTYGSSGGDLVLCFLRGVHSLNNWLCPEVLSRASGLQKQIIVFCPFRGDVAELGWWTRAGSIRARLLFISGTMAAEHSSADYRVMHAPTDAAQYTCVVSREHPASLHPAAIWSHAR